MKKIKTITIHEREIGMLIFPKLYSKTIIKDELNLKILIRETILSRLNNVRN